MAKELEKKIDGNIKEALKAKDKVKVSTLRMVKAAVQNARRRERADELDDGDRIKILASQAKRHKESIASFEKGGRSDLVEKEKAELAIIQAYLPEQLGEEEILKLIRESVTETGAGSTSDAGKVMKVVMPKVRGKADGKLVNQLVIKELSAAGETQ